MATEDPSLVCGLWLGCFEKFDPPGLRRKLVGHFKLVEILMQERRSYPAPTTSNVRSDKHTTRSVAGRYNGTSCWIDAQSRRGFRHVPERLTLVCFVISSSRPISPHTVARAADESQAALATGACVP